MVATQRDRHGAAHDEGVPFDSAESAWFWFIQAQTARNEGAQIAAGEGLCQRPCEPVDIYREIDRLYRGRRILVDHIRVLRHYGMRLMSPDPRRPREVRAHYLWREAMERLEDALSVKGIVARPSRWSAFSHA